MSEIHYHFSVNNSSPEDVTSHVTGVDEVRSDIATLINLLETVYEGSGAVALRQAHQSLDSMLGDVLHDMAVTQQQAQDQRQAKRTLDAVTQLQRPHRPKGSWSL
jgi:hypothetical protein